MIHCEGLVKIYKTEEVEVMALQGLNLDVEDGEMMAIIGASGSGKSTLLNILGGLDRPSAGQVRVGEWDLTKISEQDLVRYKRSTVGFIWQNNARNLLPYLTALENVTLPMLLNGRYDVNRAKELLDAVGLSHRMKNRLEQLSGGEQQRVAIAIALANQPKLLLADEPTGAVDTATAEVIMNIFREINREMGVTVLIVTHDLALAKKVDRVVAIRDGLTSSEFLRGGYAPSGAPGGQGDLHQEFTVVDRVGRLQIPQEYLQEMGIRDKVILEFDGEKILIKPPSQEDSLTHAEETFPSGTQTIS
ncbi:ABC transporter [[Clostridium] ultunense Esp]|uniref:ATP-binding cassette domain-containing protein n=1 Tax=Thermicanus aegyptius TaxID=94009 RepID=UPI0002B701DA|nr:ATP-binding cassette domain-containing protein [Thermicanus aegyptius]CCQ93943.1 ABC transporter [[Clostridium] ultunense Esp]